MTRYQTRVNTQTFEASVESGDCVAIDGRPYTVDMQPIDGQSLFSLLIDHESFELVIKEFEGGFRVLLWGEMYEVFVEDSQPGEPVAKKVAHTGPTGGQCAVRAPLPGLVVDAPVVVGQQVMEGQILVILESMKMENELLSPRQGTIKEIHVGAGDTPNLDDLLITLE